MPLTLDKFAASSNCADRVAKIGRGLVDLWAAHDAADAVASSGADYVYPDERFRAADEIMGRIRRLEEEAAKTPAASIDGVRVQLSLAMHEWDLPGGTPRARRLIRVALRALDCMSATPAADLACDLYAPESMGPTHETPPEIKKP